MPEAAIVGHANSAGSPAVEGSPNVSIGGAPVLRVGDHFADGSAVDAGAPHVFINGKPAARMGDPVSGGGAILQGCPRVKVGNLGGAEFGQNLALDALTRLRDNPTLTPGERLALCLPEMAAAQAERVDEINRQGWIYLHEGTIKWLSRPAYIIKDKYDNGGQEPLWMDWNWLMRYDRFRDAAAELTTREYLTIPAPGEPDPKERLTRVLEADGAFAGQGTLFDHAALPWEKLREHAFQGKTIKTWASYLDALDWDAGIIPDGFQAALADTTLYALAAGETRVSDSGERKVFIRKVGRFIHDGFDFNYDQWLGNWECSENLMGYASMDSFREAAFMRLHGRPLGISSRLDNAAFRRLRARAGYGCDFRSMCLPNIAEVEEFWYLAP